MDGGTPAEVVTKMEAKTRIGKYQEMEAIQFPPCQACGSAYRPSKPVDAFTVMFRSEDWLANLLFKFERWAQQMRKRRMRNL